MDRYCQTPKKADWKQLKIRNSAKGALKAGFHFARVFIWNKQNNEIENRLLVIRKRKTKKGVGVEIKYSFTNARAGRYTEKELAYMQGQRFFIEHSIKESKQVLGISEFQTRKWLAWQYQVALNIMAACFILKEKLRCFDDLPLLSAWDIREWISFKLYKKLDDEDMIERMFIRHLKRQQDINRAYKKRKS